MLDCAALSPSAGWSTGMEPTINRSGISSTSSLSTTVVLICPPMPNAALVPGSRQAPGKLLRRSWVGSSVWAWATAASPSSLFCCWLLPVSFAPASAVAAVGEVSGAKATGVGSAVAEVCSEISSVATSVAPAVPGAARKVSSSWVSAVILLACASRRAFCSANSFCCCCSRAMTCAMSMGACAGSAGSPVASCEYAG